MLLRLLAALIFLVEHDAARPYAGESLPHLPSWATQGGTPEQRDSTPESDLSSSVDEIVTTYVSFISAPPRITGHLENHPGHEERRDATFLPTFATDMTNLEASPPQVKRDDIDGLPLETISVWVDDSGEVWPVPVFTGSDAPAETSAFLKKSQTFRQMVQKPP